ncbi:MAG: hypothetical protein JNK52_07550, partial [Zoogloeaceae bacterium]|nr:hypothetical protein [Zoogloeaceae bacterium]
MLATAVAAIVVLVCLAGGVCKGSVVEAGREQEIMRSAQEALQEQVDQILP